MDPATALSIAGNILQFTEFAIKLVSKSTELYKNDALVEHIDLGRAADQLRKFQLPRQVQSDIQNAKLSMQLDDLHRPKEQGNEEQESEKQDIMLLSQLQETHDYCTECARDIIKAVDRLRVSGPHKKWRSFRHALSTVLGDTKLDTPEKSLNGARQQLILFLVLYTEQKRGADTNTILRTHATVQEAVMSVMQEIGQDFRKSISDLRRDLVNAQQPEQDDLIATFLRSQRAHLTPIEQALDRIEDREGVIEKAHEDTFQWVLQRNSHRDVSWHNFSEWLSDREARHNIYWVTGKPGSGKSTLMKFLADSTTTSELLSGWASPDYLYMTKCFFWSPGMPLQKSMEGLLRTLLFQLFSDRKTNHTVIQSASPWRWYAIVSGNTTQDPWSTGELLKAFASAVRQLAHHSKLFLFVDGLDEFGHDNHERQELVDLFLSLQEQKNVKMCLSSRPWDIFEDAFDGLPSLRLEDLTREDIVKFVHTNCDNSKAFRDRPSREKNLLKGEIVKKSDGLFLWVRLVVRRLQVEIQDGHRSPATLLDEIPKGLDEYFEYMLQKINPGKRAQASRILQIMVGKDWSMDSPSLMTLSFTDEGIADFASVERVTRESRDDIEARITSLKRLFQSQCMDLLVCRPDNLQTRRYSFAGVPWEYITVNYIHRSVKEFLCSGTAQELLGRYTGHLISVPRYMTNSLLTQRLFMNQFPMASNLEGDRISLELKYFVEIMGNLRLLDNAADFPACVYDRVVAIFPSILKDEQIKFWSPEIRGIFGIKEVTKFFQNRQSEAADGPLLLALMYHLDTYAEARLVSDLDDTGVKMCFTAALFSHLRVHRVPLLLLIIKQGNKIQDPLIIHEVLIMFHSHFNYPLERADQESLRQYARVTMSLIDRTSGMRSSPAALQALSAKMEKSITTSYGTGVSDSLVKHLRTVQASWVGLMPQGKRKWHFMLRGLLSRKGPVIDKARIMSTRLEKVPHGSNRFELNG
ncbi:hypothetical protein PV04_08904 [Phialophora macrospora]|uniref:Uncharacterized protein n=1 Tax=Phialophora macrospora TaxID=1851006 RepID=A0A0D2DNW3_9EURO|nr:hypothetical protein PV04_08904 [Phialophora macrospora]